MINRLIMRLLLLVFVALLLAPWALKRENGTRMISVDEFLSFDIAMITSRYKEAIQRIRSFMAEDMEIEQVKEVGNEHPESRTLYKWKNEKGEWQFSDTKPDDYISETIVIETNKNVVDFEDIKKKNIESSEQRNNKDGNEK